MNILYDLFYSKGTSAIKSQPQKLTIENESLIYSLSSVIAGITFALKIRYGC